MKHEKIVEIKNLYKSFDSVPVLQGINLDLFNGELLTILGESGCGKSTLLGCIAGFFGIDEGMISIDGQLASKKGFYTTPKQRNVGILFQDYALFPHFTVYQNIQFGLSHLSKKEQEKRIDELLLMLELQKLHNRYPHELSGGQAQRVALARSIAPRPKIILFDEPFSNLNHNLSIKMRKDIKKILKDNGLSAILVTHNRDDAFYLSDRIMLIQKGIILDSGTPKELYENPSNLESAKFLGAVNYIHDFEDIKNTSFKNWLTSKKGIFRPKHLEICYNDGIAAEVIENIFFGDWVEVIVQTEGRTFSLQSHLPLSVGDRIYLKPSM